MKQKALFIFWIFFSLIILNDLAWSRTEKFNSCGETGIREALNDTRVLGEILSFIESNGNALLIIEELNAILNKYNLDPIKITKECDYTKLNAILIILSKREPLTHIKMIVDILKQRLENIYVKNEVSEQDQSYQTVKFLYFKPEVDGTIIKKYIVKGYDVLEIRLN